MPDWSMKGWHTGNKMTLLEAFGVRTTKFSFPSLTPVLATKAAESPPQPILVNSGGTQPVQENTGGIPATQKGPLQQYARKLLRANGWGDQWDAFNSLELSEAGWNPKIANPSSQAYGLAQSLGHGNNQTQGTYSNMYGPIGNNWFGMTPRQMKEANSGNGYWQLVWMMAYIKAVYGSPRAAWAFHQANNWY